MNRKQIIQNVLDLRVLPPKTREDSELNISITKAVYTLRSGEKLCCKDKVFLVEHPELYLNDNDTFRIIKVNNLKYEVFIKRNMVARFFNQEDAAEYVMFKLKLI